MTVGLRTVNDVSYVSTINHDVVGCVGDAFSIYVPVTYAHLVLPQCAFLLRNSFHQEVHLAATLISFVRVAV